MMDERYGAHDAAKPLKLQEPAMQPHHSGTCDPFFSSHERTSEKLFSSMRNAFSSDENEDLLNGVVTTLTPKEETA
jgi:hypothetical protein